MAVATQGLFQLEDVLGMAEVEAVLEGVDGARGALRKVGAVESRRDARRRGALKWLLLRWRRREKCCQRGERSGAREIR